MISLDSVQVRWHGRTVLGPIQSHASAGDIIGLIGPPGCGKTLLLKVLCGLVPFDAGTLRVVQRDLPVLDPSDLWAFRRGIGFVFQNNALFDSRTVFENVAFPLRRREEQISERDLIERVDARIDAVGLSHARDRYPHELSGGMQKRCGIARATIAAPIIRLYDEPTAGLDPITSARILGLIEKVHRGSPGVTIIVSNEMETLLSSVDRVWMLEAGRLIFDGDKRDVVGGKASAPVLRFVKGAAEVSNVC